MQTIDVLYETVVPLKQPSRLGKDISCDQLDHWARKGLMPRRNGKIISRERVTLDFCYRGSQKFTSVEAYQRFLKKINGEEVEDAAQV